MTSCLAGIYFGSGLASGPNSNQVPYLQPQDLASVNAELAREGSSSGISSTPGSVTAADLTSAFNRGIGAFDRYRACLPTPSAGGTKAP
jgi:hypothetical protein